MQVIPVIDIRNGIAVRAVAGRRCDYRPIETPLAPGNDPRDVACGLAALHAFDAFYVADLDAIEGRGDNLSAITALAASIAPARLWVDAGFTRLSETARWLGPPSIDAVLGSESLRQIDDLAAPHDDRRLILSLDFDESGFRGDPRLLADETLWPGRVIVMTLTRVGARQGPDLTRMRDMASRAKGRRLYAAGGVRDGRDVTALQKAGAAGALVATALHDGRLTSADLAGLQAK